MQSTRKILNHEMPLAEQIEETVSTIRKEPAEVKHRVALAQLYMASRQWQQATAQLERAAQLAPACMPLAAAYNEAIRCEMLRNKVLAGESLPAMLDGAPAWVNTLASALHLLSLNDVAQAAQMRDDAFDAAQACRFEINGQAAEWLADADSRLGPVCELFMNGAYYWVPLSDIAELEAEAPVDLRDLFWLPCSVKLVDGQAFSALMPCRYPDEDGQGGDDTLLCRKTEWQELGSDTWVGLGQKIFVSDSGEFPALSVRSLVNMHASEG
ncbi:type VI secretion system accessory protein TagJ [Halopseudomonas salegens]|uniref:Type VI secretion system protein ImpE n=1 Tax=Halopseudomonas salegens TaxID=1434072 RepID=A0A1H2E0M1_9GAMM|nr:type VI secretion system accessory protein TagJ [Halopseudomonas salegens]SDT88585.1 type VI secretion system protein ImpE [Halopseudomonas salegens]